MARNNRPPIAAAKAWATGRLIEAHEDEFVRLTDEYLAAEGWEQKVETRTAWVNNSGAAAKGDTNA